MSSTLQSGTRSTSISVDTQLAGKSLSASSGTASPEGTALTSKITDISPQETSTVLPHQLRSATPQTPADNRSTTPVSMPSKIGGNPGSSNTTTTSGGSSKVATKTNKKTHAEGRWTKDEDSKLRAAVKEMSGKNWKKISEIAFGGVRSDVQCLHRWQKVLRPGLHKGPWSKEEDAIVLEYVNKSGGVNLVKWSAVAHQVKGRLGKQVRERWYNHLDPMLKKGPWAPEEDALLLQLQATMGNRWCEIAKNISGRSENAVKNRWNSAQRRARAQKENKNKDGTGTTSKKPRKTKKRKTPSDSTQKDRSKKTKDSSVDGKKKSKKRARTGESSARKEKGKKSKSKSQKKNKKDVNVVGGGSHGSNGGNSGLSVIADIGTALQMCEMISANSNSPVQSPTRPATPPTRKNETAAHVLAQSFVRISKEDDAVSALLDLL